MKPLYECKDDKDCESKCRILAVSQAGKVHSLVRDGKLKSYERQLELLIEACRCDEIDVTTGVAHLVSLKFWLTNFAERRRISYVASGESHEEGRQISRTMLSL